MEQYYKNIGKFINYIEKIIEMFFKVLFLGFRITAYIKEQIINVYSKIALKFYKLMRWMTIPYNWLIIRTWLWYIFYGGENEPLDVEGVHYIVSPPGGGKSTLAKQKMDEHMSRTGKTSYVTTKMEMPKVDATNGKKYVYHRWIDIKKYYKDGKKVMQYNTKLHNMMVIDEFHVLNNNRLNKTTKYNDFFIPFINDLVLIRHIKFRKVYLLSQVPSNDIQLMSILVRYHEVKLKKGVNYWRWIKTGKFEILPLKWRIKTYTIEPLTNKKHLIRIWSKKVDMNSLDDFETLNMASHGSDLPMDYK